MPGAIIGGVGSIIGGALQAHAAKKAAEAQAKAAAEVAAKAREQAGKSAAGVTDAAAQAAAGVTDSSAAGATAIEGGIGTANDLLKGVYDTARTETDPYRTLGSDAAGVLDASIKDGSLTDKFQFSKDDPSYQFRLDEGQKALERSNAVGGHSLGGASAKALARYGQNFASTEYQAAFNRFQTDRAQRASILQGLTGVGQTATGQLLAAGRDFGDTSSSNIMTGTRSAADLRYTGSRDAGGFGYSGARDAGNFGMEGEKIAGDATMGGANAQAAGTVGSANAWASGIGNAANLIGAGFMNRGDGGGGGRGVQGAPKGFDYGAASDLYTNPDLYGAPSASAWPTAP